MHTWMTYATAAAAGAVLIVLLLGFWNLMRGRNARTSQLLMRWRVGLQFLAILLILLAVYLNHH